MTSSSLALQRYVSAARGLVVDLDDFYGDCATPPRKSPAVGPTCTPTQHDSLALIADSGARYPRI